MNGAFVKLTAKDTIFIDVEFPKLKHYMTFTLMYLPRSRTDINFFLATEPHLLQDMAEIVSKGPEHKFLYFTCLMAHGPTGPSADASLVL